ncbi:hypothetical protein C8F04DRAFT_1241247 [Mycena alexandri]|uniref:Uncharacterized protein n=1 Tax=Mycena alexandri TaxID=1745969 RepID=A0AAD6WS77_9AGAR|nr:hypothetical protein C8F04DRAFT_1241247 [Mycena alexandri]
MPGTSVNTDTSPRGLTPGTSANANASPRGLLNTFGGRLPARTARRLCVPVRLPCAWHQRERGRLPVLAAQPPCPATLANADASPRTLLNLHASPSGYPMRGTSANADASPRTLLNVSGSSGLYQPERQRLARTVRRRRLPSLSSYPAPGNSSGLGLYPTPSTSANANASPRTLLNALGSSGLPGLAGSSVGALSAGDWAAVLMYCKKSCGTSRDHGKRGEAVGVLRVRHLHCRLMGTGMVVSSYMFYIVRNVMLTFKTKIVERLREYTRGIYQSPGQSSNRSSENPQRRAVLILHQALGPLELERVAIPDYCGQLIGHVSVGGPAKGGVIIHFKSRHRLLTQDPAVGVGRIAAHRRQLSKPIRDEFLHFGLGGGPKWIDWGHNDDVLDAAECRGAECRRPARRIPRTRVRFIRLDNAGLGKVWVFGVVAYGEGMEDLEAAKAFTPELPEGNAGGGQWRIRLRELLGIQVE